MKERIKMRMRLFKYSRRAPVQVRNTRQLKIIKQKFILRMGLDKLIKAFMAKYHIKVEYKEAL